MYYPQSYKQIYLYISEIMFLKFIYIKNKQYINMCYS